MTKASWLCLLSASPLSTRQASAWLRFSLSHSDFTNSSLTGHLHCSPSAIHTPHDCWSYHSNIKTCRFLSSPNPSLSQARPGLVPAHQSSLLRWTITLPLIASPATRKLLQHLESKCYAATALCTYFHYSNCHIVGQLLLAQLSPYQIMATEGLILALQHLAQYLTGFQIFTEQNFTRG